MKRNALLATVVGFSLPAGLLMQDATADTYTFTGLSAGEGGEYTNVINWTPAGVPNLNNTSDTALLNADSGPVTYNGGDLTIQGGGVLQIDGGSFTQVTSVSWMQLHTGGTINVNGGTFNMGTAPRFNDLSGTFHLSAGAANLTEVYMASGGLFQVSGGTAVVSTTFGTASGSTLTVNGGALTLSTGNLVISSGFNFNLTSGSLSLSGTSEFKPANGGTVSIDGGTLNAYVLSFDGADTVLDFGGGAINLSGGDHFNGIFGGGGNKYVNFTLDSFGTLFIDNISLGAFDGLFTGGSIRAGGITDISAFSITAQGNGYKAQLLNPVPEPSTVAMIALAGLGYVVLRRRKA